VRIELAKIESEVLEGDFQLPETRGGSEAEAFLLKGCEVHYRLYRISATDIHLRARYRGTMELACTSCLELYDSQVSDTFEVVLTVDRERHQRHLKEQAADGSLELLEGDFVDMGEQVMNTILLNLPIAHPCSSGCKGICPVCGVNRNETACDCGSRTIDPRWQALKTLMDKKE